MQYGLRTLMLVTTILAALCGLLFAVPWPMTLLAFSFMIWISPAVWISGVAFGQDGRRAFFLGGIVTGIVPFMVCTYYSVMMVMEETSNFSNWFQKTSTNDDGSLLPRLGIFIAWIFPGLLSFSGGGLSYLTYRLVRPTASVHSLPQRETHVESSEVTAVPETPPFPKF